MFKVRDVSRGFAALLLMLQTVLIAVPHAASAASGNPSYCDPGVDRLTNQNIQNKVPVILVYGASGKVSDWGSINNPGSFAGTVNAIPGVAVAHILDYNSLTWVDNTNSGPKLAKTIDCVSQLSAHNGGKGKVIVIGYSMGGLVARDALSRRSTDSQRAIADEVGQVVTIAAPNTGTTGIFWPQVAQLVHFPSQTVVHAIAADVTRVYYDTFSGKELRREQPHDDTLVSVASAHDEYSTDVNKGGGQATVSCEKKYYQIPYINVPLSSDTAPCEHGQLIKNATNGVREDTVGAIKKYVASLSAISLTIGGLTTSYDNRWINVGYGASGPGQDGSADDTTNTATCTNCNTTPPPATNAFVQITNLERWCTGDALGCILGSSPIAGAAPAVTIGGLTPDSSARYYDSGYMGTSLAWCFSTQKVCVEYRRAVDTPQLNMSQALLDVFNTATWANP